MNADNTGSTQDRKIQVHVPEPHKPTIISITCVPCM
jgi:hypothetical protein